MKELFDNVKRYLWINGGHLLQLFKEFDRTGDGYLQKDEFTAVLFKMGIKENPG